jgi:hypothetical protein
MATDNGLWKISGDSDVPPRRLTTTDLEITEVRRIDDGAEERVIYCVAVRHSGRERVVTVTPEAIERPVTWIASSGLVGATVMPGCGSAALAACQVLSTGDPERNIQAGMKPYRADLEAVLDKLTARANPALRGAEESGPNVATILLVAAGDNPERFKNEAA